MICTINALAINTPAFPINVIFHDQKGKYEMAFIITKTKAALNAKSKSHKKQMSHKVSLAAMAATAPDDLIKDMKLDKRHCQTNVAERVWRW